MDSSEFQYILAQNLQLSLRQLKLKKHYILDHDNAPNDKFKSTTEQLQKKKIRVLEWTSMTHTIWVKQTLYCS